MSRRRAVLLGGSSSIGSAIAQELAARGYDLFIGFRHGLDAAEACAGIAREHGAQARTMHFDFQDDATTKALVKELGEDPIDVLVHAAGAFQEADLQDTSEDMFIAQFKANAIGPALLTSRLSRQLAASSQRDGACVVFFGDVHAEMVPRSGATAYLASKGATHALVRLLALELAPTRVVGIAPGVVSWPQDWPEQRREEYLRRVPLAREGVPEDVARLVGALVEDAGYVTGTIIPLDGGRHLR